MASIFFINLFTGLFFAWQKLPDGVVVLFANAMPNKFFLEKTFCGHEKSF